MSCVQEALGSIPAPYKLGMMIQAYNPSTREVGPEESEVQAHTPTYSEGRNSLRYLNPHHNKQTQTQQMPLPFPGLSTSSYVGERWPREIKSLMLKNLPDKLKAVIHPLS